MKWFSLLLRHFLKFQEGGWNSGVYLRFWLWVRMLVLQMSENHRLEVALVGENAVRNTPHREGYQVSSEERGYFGGYF